MRVEILGDERRRRWTDDEKLEIVLSVGTDGASVTQVAHNHDGTRQQIYSCRRELRRKGGSRTRRARCLCLLTSLFPGSAAD